MKIIRTYLPNSADNYNYLAYCPTTGVAAAVDPFDADHLISIADDNKLNITQIWVTHEHWDHIKDVNRLKELTGAQVYAPHTCKNAMDADIWLEDGDEVDLSQHHSVKLFLTPGHIAGHGVYLYQDLQQPTDNFILAGDTLFNAGVGNTKSGDVEQLYHSIERLHQLLTEQCQIYVGHDYMVSNLKFTLKHCPTLKAAEQALQAAEAESHDSRPIQRWQDEKSYNLFLRLDSNEVRELTGKDSRIEQFKALRALRDQW